MSNVMDYVMKKENLKKASAIRLEIDYELLTLFDAMQAGSKTEIMISKEILEVLVTKLNILTK